MQDFVQNNPYTCLILFILAILFVAYLLAKFGGDGRGSSGGGWNFDDFGGGGDD